MKLFYNILLLLILSLEAHTQSSQKSFRNQEYIPDTMGVIKLNELAFESRLVNPEQTIINAGKALKLAESLDYTNGIAESYRVIGVGKYYMNNIDEAIESYLTALKYYKAGICTGILIMKDHWRISTNRLASPVA
jgi:tetratricopeptide (TPR) repeat protein